MDVCFLKRDRKGVDLDGKGCGEDLVGFGRTVSQYVLHEKNLLEQKGSKKKLPMPKLFTNRENAHYHLSSSL